MSMRYEGKKMLSADMILKLKELSDGLSLLYVEDNEGLRAKALSVLRKLFSNVISAEDGEEGYLLFKEYRPKIVISDIRMPKLDGLSMIKKIKQIEPTTKFIITSAFDDKEYLLEAIDAGVFHYMKKPVKIDDLAQTLIEAINSINIYENSSVFDTYMDDILNYQSDLLALMSKDKAIFVNQTFLDFFEVNNIEEFDEKYTDIGSLLLEHKGFLSTHSYENWFSEVTKEADKLFHVKIADKENEKKHFILKMHPVPKKKNIYIMSLNDITDLNLLALFDSKAVSNDDKIKDYETLIKLMKVVQQNNAEIKIHNFYKGLTITNPGCIVDIDDKSVKIKTSYMQEKAAQYQHSIFITSEIFPSAVLCDKIESIDFEHQTMSLKDLRFVARDPSQRKHVRVVPEDKHTVSLFINNRKFYNDIHICDISIEAVKIDMISLPAGLSPDTNVNINIVLEHYNKPIIIHCDATVFRIDELSKSYTVVLMLLLSKKDKKLLIDYIARRQMNLISEFKGLQFE